MDMINYTMKMFGILEDMREAARAPRLKFGQADEEASMPDPSALLSVNSRIDDMINGMPAHLHPNADYTRWNFNEDSIKCFRVQSQTITFRLLLLRVVLLRPSLLAEAQRWTSRSPNAVQTASVVLQERLHNEICILCLDTVHSMLEEIHGSLSVNSGLSVWFMLHCESQ